MVGEHTAHREAAKIDAIAINIVLRRHLINNGFKEVDVTVSAYIPTSVDTIGEHYDKLGSIAHGLNTYFSFRMFTILKLRVYHIVRILVAAMTKDKQRPLLTQVLGSVDNIRPGLSPYSDIVCPNRYLSCRQQQEHG